LWYDSSGMDYTCCGDADAEAEAPPRFTSSPRFAHVASRTDEYYPPWRRKEAISWKTHFLAVANVVKVIWFRFRTSVARELLSSTKHGSAQIPLACTILRSVMVTSLLMNPLVTDRSTHIAATASKFVASHRLQTFHSSLLTVCWEKGGKRHANVPFAFRLIREGIITPHC